MTTDRPEETAEARQARLMLVRFLSRAGLEGAAVPLEAQQLLHDHIQTTIQHGLRESDLAVIGQAVIRAVGRVVAAESEAIARLRNVLDGDTDTQLEAVVGGFETLGRDIFGVLHGLLLRRTLAEPALDRSRRSLRPAAVAHVDVVSSTALLERATLADTQRLVDGLFASAQAAVQGRNAEVVKYVGDGVFLVGSDPQQVAQASLDCIGRLAADVGLKARAGLAFGRVVHRAGDVFGLPVNVSHALTKSAPPGALLAAAIGEARLPGAMITHPRTIQVRGMEAPLTAYELHAA